MTKFTHIIKSDLHTTEKINYIVLSDLYLGESGSFLTPCKSENFDVIQVLSSAFSDIVSEFYKLESPKFILNRDILGLSFNQFTESFIIKKTVARFQK